MDIPDDRLDVQCLVQAIEDFIDAKRRHDAARDAYQGFSWGYSGRDAIGNPASKIHIVAHLGPKSCP